NLDNRLAVEGRGLDVLNVVDEICERLLVGSRQPALELLGAEAGVLPGDGDDWNIDVGKDVGRCAQNDHRGGNQNQNCQHDEGVRPVQGQAHDRHECSKRAAAGPVKRTSQI